MSSPHARQIEPPLPSLTQDTEAFLTSGFDGVLAIHRCGSCQRYAHPPTPVCPACWSRDMVASPVSGQGTVVSYTINHYPWHPAFQPPYVIAVVELDEQANLRLTARLLTAEPDSVAIGDRVRVAFTKYTDIALPVFQLTGKA